MFNLPDKQPEMIEFDSIFVIISMLLKNHQAIGRNPKIVLLERGQDFLKYLNPKARVANQEVCGK